MLFVPRGFAHGFLTLEDDTEFLYKCDDVYDPGYEGGVSWDDATLQIDWSQYFDEYDFTAYIACESQGARFYNPEGVLLEEINDLSAVRVQLLPTTTTAQHRALLASAPAVTADLMALRDLHPLERDELIFERNINSTWQCIARIATAPRSASGLVSAGS